MACGWPVPHHPPSAGWAIQAAPPDTVLDVFATAGAEDDDEHGLRQAVMAVGSHRALKHMTELTRELARSGTNATLIRRSWFRDEPREARLTVANAGRLHAMLSRTHKDTEVIYLEGRLSGVRWTRNTFELEISDAEPVSGHVVADIRPEVSDAFDHMVRAELEKTVTTSDVDEVGQATYRMTNIARL